MDEHDLKKKIAVSFQNLIADVAAAETLQSPDNPFTHVVISREFLEAQTSAPVLSDEELRKILGDIDEAIKQDRSLQELMGLVKTGLGLLAKYGVV